MDKVSRDSDVLFRVQLRVRIAKSFSSDETELTTRVSGRDVQIRGSPNGQKLNVAEWIVVTAGGFHSEDDALSFGHELRLRLEVASLVCRLGVDSGDDKPTSHMSDEFARALCLIGPDEHVAPVVHGISVYRDDGRARFFQLSATAKVTTAPQPLLNSFAGISVSDSISRDTLEPVRLLNMALMTEDRTAKIVLSIAAVELIAERQEWSRDQMALIEKLKSIAQDEAKSNQECEEVYIALKLMHRLSIRQSIFRLIDRLSLSQLKDVWDDVYDRRSKLLHAKQKMDNSEIMRLADDAFDLALKIVLSYICDMGVSTP